MSGFTLSLPMYGAIGANFYLGLKIPELQSLCRERHLPTTGTKTLLIQRLNAHDVERGCDDDTTYATQTVPFDGKGYDPAKLVGMSLDGYCHWNNYLRLDFTTEETLNFRITQTCMDWGGEGHETHVSEPIFGTDLNLRKAFERMLSQIHQGGPPTKVIGACIAIRASVRRNPTLPVGEWRRDDGWYLNNPPVKHRVIGLQLEGMEKMGYIYCWDKKLVTRGAEGDAFCDVELGAPEPRKRIDSQSEEEEEEEDVDNKMSVEGESSQAGREELEEQMDLDTPNVGEEELTNSAKPKVQLGSDTRSAKMNTAAQVKLSPGPVAMKRKLRDEEDLDERARKFRGKVGYYSS